VVPQPWSEAFSPWTGAPALVASTPMLKGADHLRRSLIPSLLEARRINETLANPLIELFETARVYLPQPAGLPREQRVLALASGAGLLKVKGTIEALLETLNRRARLETAPTRQELFAPERCCRLVVGGQTLGFAGELAAAALKQFGLRAPAAAAEVDLAVLEAIAVLVPKHEELSAFPAIDRDVNLVVDEAVAWSALESTVRAAAGLCLECVDYRETYRDPGRDGTGRKRLLFSMTLRSHERTLTNDEADQIRQRVVDDCARQHGAALLGV
jgi:phenylalanyl-tRNA synthetase beta chain